MRVTFVRDSLLPLWEGASAERAAITDAWLAWASNGYPEQEISVTVPRRALTSKLNSLESIFGD